MKRNRHPPFLFTLNFRSGLPGALETECTRGEQTGSVYRARKRAWTRGAPRVVFTWIMRAAIGACCASSLLIAKCGGVALKACRDAAWRGKRKQGEESPRGHVIEARHTRNQDKPRASSSRDPIWPGFLHHPGHSWVLNENTSVAKLLIHARCVRRVTRPIYPGSRHFAFV